MTGLQYAAAALLTGLAASIFCGFHRMKADETIAVSMVCAVVWPLAVPVAIVLAAHRIAYVIGDAIGAMVRS